MHHDPTKDSSKILGNHAKLLCSRDVIANEASFYMWQSMEGMTVMVKKSYQIDDTFRGGKDFFK